MHLDCVVEMSLVFYFFLCTYSQTSGEISFADLECHLLKLCGDKNDAIMKELLITCSRNMQCANERLNQIQQYHQLGAYSRGAKTMIVIKEMFELTGDFSSVETLVDLVGLIADFIVFIFCCDSSVTSLCVHIPRSWTGLRPKHNLNSVYNQVLASRIKLVQALHLLTKLLIR